MEKQVLNHNLELSYTGKLDCTKKDDKYDFSGIGFTVGTLHLNRVVIAPVALEDNVVTDFLSSGVIIPWTHHQSGTDPVGYPIEASMSGYAFVLSGKFHSDSRSVSVKTIIDERLENGKSVGLSIGASANMTYWGSGKDYYDFLVNNKADMSFFNLDSFKDDEKYIIVANKINSIQHFTLTMEPADTSAKLLQTIQPLLSSQDNVVHATQSDLDLLELRTRMLRK